MVNTGYLVLILLLLLYNRVFVVKFPVTLPSVPVVPTDPDTTNYDHMMT